MQRFIITVLALVVITSYTGAYTVNRTELTVHFTGNWDGKHRLNESGSSGLAVMNSILMQNSESIKVYLGSFSGKKPSSYTGDYKNFVKSSIYPNSFDLFHYMKFDAIALNSSEMEPLNSITEVHKNPFLSFNRRHAVAENRNPMDSKKKHIESYRIIERSSLRILLSAMTEAKEPVYDSRPAERFLTEMKKSRGANLFVVAIASSNESHKTADYFNADLFLKDLSESQLKLNPFHARTESILNRTVIAKTGQNRFYRLQTGPYVCEVNPAEMCSVTFTFRNGQLIGARARFHSFDEKLRNHRYVKPDPVLTDLLNQP